MSHWHRAALCAALLATHAYADGGASKPAATAAAAPKYESVFDGYRRYSDEKLRSWREVNDTAAALGGHVGQLRGTARNQAAAPHEYRHMAPAKEKK